MRICFTGTSSVGKSVLVAHLQKLPRFKDYTVVDSVPRELHAKDVPINDTADNFDLTQLLVINKHLECLILNKNLIVSRCIFDGYCYTDYLWQQGKVHNLVLNYAEFILVKYLYLYDFIFYIRPEFNLVNDEVRSFSIEFQDNMAKCFEQNLKFILQMKKVNIIHISGSIDQRIQQILFHIDRREEI